MTNRIRRSAASIPILLLAACGPGEAPSGSAGDRAPGTEAPWFEERAAAAGLDFVHVSGFEQRFDFPEIMSGGVGLFDYDGDGDLDVYLVQGGDLRERERELPTNRLYRNLGGARFEDVTEAAGVGDAGYGMGCACGDFDGDGDVDLYVTNVGPNVLYRNEGDGTFRDVTAAAGVGDPGWSTSAVFADYDGDERLDLFVVDYVRWSLAGERECTFAQDRRDYCSPNSYDAPAPDLLYRNRGDGTFEDVSEAAGLRADFGNGLGVGAGDLDGDGRLDFYVANDMNANQLWLQTRPGHFEERALLAGCALSGSGSEESGMGIQVIDADHDGDLDLFLSHLRRQSNTFYLNQGGGGGFEDSTARFGLSNASLPFTGFGLGFADFDHDGDLDLYVANGEVAREEPFEDPADPYAQPDLLFEQRAPVRSGGRFEERRPISAPERIATGRGLALGDLDDDGDVDLVVVNRDAPPFLLLNRVADGRPSLTLRVLDSAGSDAYGARVRVTAGGYVQWRTVDPGYGYCSSNDPRVHFGLGDAVRVDEVLVRWPDGTERTFSDVQPGGVRTLSRP